MLPRLLCLFVVLAAALSAQGPEGFEYFEKYIRPVLVERCYACHSDAMPQPMGALRLDTRQGLLTGGNAGPALVPGVPERSILIHALSYEDELKMPPGGKLTDDELARFREWVRMGAPDPRTGNAVSQEPRLDADHWAFQPPRKPDVPGASGATDIDRFVAAKLAEKGLHPAPPAIQRTQLRRLYVDLIGVPPTYEQVRAFERDGSPAAWERVVDELLRSPHFGERWGRRWLDVVRYSDEGFQARAFPAAWTYRDWVIRAFDDDMPYDRFVLRQLAADLLPDEERRHLAALGFLTLGINLPRPTDVPENLDDRIDVVTRGLLGLSVSCARCHDHKFDPIPQKDYYSLYGVFLNSEDVLEPQPIEPAPSGAAADYYAAKLAKRRQAIDDFKLERLEAHKAEFRAPETLEKYIQAARDGRNVTNTQLEKLAIERNLNLYLLSRWQKYLLQHQDLDSPAPELAEALAQAGRAEPWDDPGRERLRQAIWGPDAPTNVPFEDFWWIQNEGDSNTVKNLTWQYNAVMSDWGWRGGPAHAAIVRDADRLEPARVFVRGNQHDKGAEVPRKFLAVLGGKRFEQGSGRLELARVIADPRNPLTARVMANRIWQHLFGHGIVRSTSDFGLRGDAPTHPELLDWLAATFVEDGWSVKRLIKRIVLSETYRQASADRPAARAKDPENKLLWRQNPRRMDFEAMRDTMLAVAGRLEDGIGGAPFQLGALPSVPRRSVYAYISREQPSALLRNFDFSNPEQHTSERQTTTVPQQALFLMNSEFLAEQARYVAERSGMHVPTLYRRVLARDPSPREVEIAQAFLRGEEKPRKGSETAASPWRYGFGRIDVSRGAVETFTPFRVWIDEAWQQSSLLPHPVAGAAMLSAGGGAPGDDADSAVIRRWIAPFSGAVRVDGELRHALGAQGKRFDYSNGVRGWIISSRRGKLGSWTVRGETAKTEIESLTVEAGETIDFAVDSLDDYEADGFSWAPEIEESPSPGARSDMTPRRWSARDDFAGPPTEPLSRWERLAQTLLETNELAFVD